MDQIPRDVKGNNKVRILDVAVIIDRPAQANAVRASRLQTRVVSVLRPEKMPGQPERDYGFGCDDPSSPDIVTSVTASGPSDLGEDGLCVGDRIMKVHWQRHAIACAAAPSRCPIVAFLL